MKIIPIVLFLIILTLPAFSNADIAPKGEGYVEYKDNGLNILYCLVNSSEFFTEWAKPQTPFIENISEYIRGDSIFPVIVFGTDNEEDLPNLKLTYNIKIYKPDGSIYGDFKDLPIVDHSVEQYYMYILEQPIVLTIEPDDPLGKYKIDIIIHDVKNSLDIPLSQKFEVKETIERVLFMDTLSEIGNIEVAGDFIAKYYITPRPDLIDDALLVLFDSGFLNGEPDKSSAYGFFSIVFAENNDKINEWKELGKQRS